MTDKEKNRIKELRIQSDKFYKELEEIEKSHKKEVSDLLDRLRCHYLK